MGVARIIGVANWSNADGHEARLRGQLGVDEVLFIPEDRNTEVADERGVAAVGAAPASSAMVGELADLPVNDLSMVRRVEHHAAPPE